MKTNWLIKFYNGNFKKLFKTKHRSAITLVYLFEHCSLNTEFFDFIAKWVKSFYSIENNSKHVIKLVCRDITVMAEYLACNLITSYPRKVTRFEVVDVFALGLLRIAGKALLTFNIKKCDNMYFDYMIYKATLDNQDDKVDEEVTQFFAVDYLGL